MNWRWKAFLQVALSAVPGGEHANYFLQKYVARTLPIPDAEFDDHVHYARQHIDAICRHSKRPVTQATFYEFGAGWDLISPLAFYAFGVENQILIDVRKLLRPSLVNESIQQFQRTSLQDGFLRKPDKHLADTQDAMLTQLREFYGINYRAPCDPRRTTLDPDTIDCITSTSTLEHISVAHLKQLLNECHRILRPGGIMSFIIDYGDHYSYFDPGISAYNYIKYSDTKWAFFNPSLHYQNRLRHPDYLNLLKAAGFQILEEQRYGDSPAKRKIVGTLAIHKRFRSYTLEDLVVGSALIVSRKSV
jgi:SAM-dependent methyltransferase